MGYSPGRSGVGGVRNHLLALKEHARRPVRLFPEEDTLHYAQRPGAEGCLEGWAAGLDLTGWPVVHSHVDPRFVRACARAHEQGSRWVHTYHTLYFSEDWGGSLAPWQQEINEVLLGDARRADVRIAISPWLQDHLRHEHGIDTVVVPNGFRVEACERARAARFTGPRSIVPGYVLFVGSLARVKNPLMFVALARSLPERRFVMIGKELTPGALRELAREPLPDNLSALGPVTHAEALDAMAGAGVFVMPSRSEGLPTALMEAMALGRACVATDAFGCRDVIGDSDHGVLVPPDDLEALTSGVLEAIERAELGPRAARRARERFDWRVVIRDVERIWAGEPSCGAGGR